jgi:riboflavin synthase
VNLERALRPGDRLDGHVVQGHVDGQAVVERIDRSAGQWVARFSCGRDLTDQMVAKGSVAIDGVSLTLAGLSDGRFSVSLIPTTLAETTFPDLRLGDSVNIETDVLGKYVRRALGGQAGAQGGLTLEKLRQAGFD